MFCYIWHDFVQSHVSHIDSFYLHIYIFYFIYLIFWSFFCLSLVSVIYLSSHHCLHSLHCLMVFTNCSSFSIRDLCLAMPLMRQKSACPSQLCWHTALTRRLLSCAETGHSGGLGQTPRLRSPVNIALSKFIFPCRLHLLFSFVLPKVNVRTCISFISFFTSISAFFVVKDHWALYLRDMETPDEYFSSKYINIVNITNSTCNSSMCISLQQWCSNPQAYPHSGCVSAALREDHAGQAA